LLVIVYLIFVCVFITAAAAAATAVTATAPPNPTNTAGKSLKALIEEGQSIPTIRKLDLSEDLTEDEQAIIRARVRIQQLQYAEYERKENQKKVHMIWDVHPNVTEEEALKALEECQGDEDEAIANLTSWTYIRNLRLQIAKAKSTIT